MAAEAQEGARLWRGGFYSGTSKRLALPNHRQQSLLAVRSKLKGCHQDGTQKIASDVACQLVCKMSLSAQDTGLLPIFWTIYCSRSNPHNNRKPNNSGLTTHPLTQVLRPTYKLKPISRTLYDELRTIPFFRGGGGVV